MQTKFLSNKYFVNDKSPARILIDAFVKMVLCSFFCMKEAPIDGLKNLLRNLENSDLLAFKQLYQMKKAIIAELEKLSKLPPHQCRAPLPFPRFTLKYLFFCPEHAVQLSKSDCELLLSSFCLLAILEYNDYVLLHDIAGTLQNLLLFGSQETVSYIFKCKEVIFLTIPYILQRDHSEGKLRVIQKLLQTLSDKIFESCLQQIDKDANNKVKGKEEEKDLEVKEEDWLQKSVHTDIERLTKERDEQVREREKLEDFAFFLKEKGRAMREELSVITSD